MRTQSKLFFILFGTVILARLAFLPYALAAGILKNTGPLWAFIPADLIISAANHTIHIFLGLFFAQKVGLGTPILKEYFDKKQINTNRLQKLLKISLIYGVLIGIAIFVVHFLCFNQLETHLIQAPNPALWKRFFASFYGGICEEIIVRLFLMSMLVWIFFKFKKTDLSVWIAIILTSILLGFGDSSNPTLLLGLRCPELSQLILTQSLLLNGISGISFGWLYWKNGLEVAIIAHFTTY